MTTAVKHRYEPRGAARRLFSTRDSEVLMDGPAGTGKSLACLYRLHLACLKHPRIRCLIVRKTAVSLAGSTLVTFEQRVATEALANHTVRWYGGSPREPAAYRYSNGSTIVVGGMDKPEKVLSTEYDLIFADEATELTLTDWETLGTRLRNGRLAWQQQIAACNPVQPTHWMNKRADAGGMTRLLSRHSDNPAYVNTDGSLTEAGTAYLAQLDRLTGIRRSRLKDGIWAGAEGLVYEEYDPAVHVVDPFEIPADWPRFWSVDFGFTNPFVCQMWAEDPDGRLYLYREFYRAQRTVDQHCADIASVVMESPEKLPGEPWRGEWKEPRPRAVVGDHDAEGRAQFTKELGLPITAANKKVTEGIQAVQRRLRLADDGRPRLYLFRDAVVSIDKSLADSGRPVSTEQEIVSYCWLIKPGGAVQEVPHKEDDHGQDSARYLVAHRDLTGRPRLRFMQ